MLFSYAIVDVNGPPRYKHFSIYIIICFYYSFSSLYINEERLTQELRTYLDNTVTRPYDKVTEDIKEFANENKKIWISPSSSYAIYSAVVAVNKVFNLSLLLNEIFLMNEKFSRIF